MPAFAPWTETEAQKVERWRFQELERAGYPTAIAVILATRHDLDLHEACDLVRRGCSPETAYWILV